MCVGPGSAGHQKHLIYIPAYYPSEGEGEGKARYDWLSFLTHPSNNTGSGMWTHPALSNSST